MLNRTIVQGRLCADPELRHLPDGTPVASFSLAVERDFADKSTGERKADFIDITAWRSTAEFVSKWFTKGQLARLYLRVRLRSRRAGFRRLTTPRGTAPPLLKPTTF